MIDVTYHKQYNDITVTGHAGAGDYGEDVICAGVTALATGLAVNIRNMADKGAFMAWSCEAESGNAHIYVRPKPRYKEHTRLIMDAFAAAMEYYAGISDGYISYTVLG